MNTALAIKSVSMEAQVVDTLKVTVAQLDALAGIISDIDSIKNFAPNELPRLIANGKHAINAIWHTLLFPTAAHELEIATETLDAFAVCFNCIQDLAVGNQMDLLQPLIETAHDLMTLMLGDKVHLVYAPEDL